MAESPKGGVGPQGKKWTKTWCNCSKTSDILEQLHQDIDTNDTIMKLSGTIGVTQKTMTFDTHVCLIL